MLMQIGVMSVKLLLQYALEQGKARTKDTFLAAMDDSSLQPSDFGLLSKVQRYVRTKLTVRAAAVRGWEVVKSRETLQQIDTLEVS